MVRSVFLARVRVTAVRWWRDPRVQRAGEIFNVVGVGVLSVLYWIRGPRWLAAIGSLLVLWSGVSLVRRAWHRLRPRPE